MFENDTLKVIARHLQKTIGQVALHWHLNRNTIIIPKSSNRARIKENKDIFIFLALQPFHVFTG
ncbi:aldo/keto reductase [Paenibacillus sp. NPDC058071]|uniref:aldo/keto reductase n=1 Tax=Paenibacillus sp. NPDC058071 TaxID=3346326 RepID=UPI0036DD0F3C